MKPGKNEGGGAPDTYAFGPIIPCKSEDQVPAKYSKMSSEYRVLLNKESTNEMDMHH